jgi:uncharacterized protein with HEPN domain
MVPDRRDAAHLWSMVEPARYLVKKSAEITVEELHTSQESQYAIAKALELVGEGARRVSEPFRAAHPELPWARMRGMRHYLVHEYDRIDWPTVWETITVSVPELLRELESLLPDVPAEELGDNPL